MTNQKDLTTAADDKLIDLARAGDVDATECLLKRYLPLVTYTAQHYFLPGGDRDDLIQEGMLGLLQAIHTFASDRSVPFASWAKLQVRQAIFRTIRRANSFQAQMNNSALNLDCINEMPTRQGFIESDNWQGLTIEVEPDPNSEQWLESFVLSLTALEQAVLKAYLSDLSYRQIGSALDLSRSQVANALSRVRKKLRERQRGRLS
ncbi:sigma-70 family RNA polymerase sigma factor [Oscillospiraceae bacterium HV4-5-C5C]|nr:sigma-70 family RNA polymerase sigma factor [Oscillospiraceae bacterium HV4-5-C5C]